MDKLPDIASELNTFEMLKLGSFASECTEATLRMLKAHGIEKLLCYTFPKEVFADDAMTFGSLSTRSGNVDLEMNTNASVCHTLLFSLARMMTMETPPWEIYGDLYNIIRRGMWKKMNAMGRFRFLVNEVLMDVENMFGRGCISPDTTYQAVEPLFDDNMEIVAYKLWIFLPCLEAVNPPDRLSQLFKSNSIRQTEIATKRPAFEDKKLLKLASGKGEKDEPDFLHNLDHAYITGHFNLVRPVLLSGPLYRLSYEVPYLPVKGSTVWCQNVAQYLRFGMQNSKHCKIIDDNFGHRAPYDPKDYESMSKNPDEIIDKHNDVVEDPDHPYNPCNVFSKEVSFFLFNKKVRAEQCNIATYFNTNGMANARNTKEMFALNIKDAEFKGFPFPETVFFYRRKDFSPSVLFNMLLPSALLDEDFLGYFRNIEKRKNTVFVTSEEYTRRKESETEYTPWNIDLPNGATEQDILDKALFETIVYKSDKPKNIKALFDRYSKGDPTFTLELIEVIGQSVKRYLETTFETFTKTGAPLKKTELQHKSIQDIKFSTFFRGYGGGDSNKMDRSDDEIIMDDDILVELHHKNTDTFDYLEKKYGASDFYGDLIENVRQINTTEFWRAFLYSDRVSPTIKKSRHDVMNRPREMQWPEMQPGYTQNLSCYADMVIKDQSFFTDSLTIVDKQKILQLLHLASYAAFIYSYDQTHQSAAVGLSGISSAGKSACLMAVATICTEGSVRIVSYSSAKALTIEGNNNDFIMIQHEMNEADFGGNKNAKPGDIERSRMWKEGLETGRIVSEVFNVTKDNMEKGKRELIRYVHSYQGCHLGAFNFSLVGKDTALLNRFLMLWVALKNASYGYRIKDAKAHQGYDNWLNENVVNKQIQEYKLLHFYGLVFAKMLQANVFGRGICMEGVDRVIGKFDEINQQETGVKTDTRFIGQIKLMLQAAVIKYLTRITTTTPMARTYSHKDGKFQKFHPRIFTELGSNFMFVTKEMIIHVLTLLDDTWKQNMNRKVMAELADYFLTELEEAEGTDSKHMFMLDQTAKPGSNKRNRRYVWVNVPTEEDLIASLCKKVKNVQMRPEDMARVIREQMFETVEVEQNPFDNDEDDVEDDDDNKSGSDEGDDMDLEDKREQKKVVSKILSAVKDADNDKANNLTKMMQRFAMASIGKSATNDSNNNNNNNTTTGSSSAKKRQRDEPDQKDVQKKRKTPNGTKRRSKVDLMIKGENVHGGGKFIAFNIEALKKIRTEFNSKNDTMSYALERVFGDKSFQVYSSQITQVLNDLKITEKELLEQPFITGAEGKTITYSILKKKQDKEYTENVTANMWRISPVKYFGRSDRITFQVRNRIISSANAALMYGGKPIVNQHMNNKMDVLVMHTEDFDCKAYETNCKLNLVPALDTRAIVALPPVTKKFVVSLVNRDFPVVARAAKENPLHYPKSFITSEFYRALLLHVFDPKRNEDDVEVVKERIELFKKLFASSDKMNRSKMQVDETSGAFVPELKPHSEETLNRVMSWIETDCNSNDPVKAIDSAEDMMEILPHLMNDASVGVGSSELDPNNPVAMQLMKGVPSMPDNRQFNDNISGGIMTRDEIDGLDQISLENVSAEDAEKRSMEHLSHTLNKEVADVFMKGIKTSRPDSTRNDAAQKNLNSNRTNVDKISIELTSIGNSKTRRLGSKGVTVFSVDAYQNNAQMKEAEMQRKVFSANYQVPSGETTPITNNNTNNNNTNTGGYFGGDVDHANPPANPQAKNDLAKMMRKRFNTKS